MVSSTPWPHFTPGKGPLYRRLGGPQGQSGRVENLVPTGIRSRTIQPVAQSLYRLSYPAHCVAHRVGKGIALLFPALEWGEWSAARPDCTLPPGKTQYPFYRRLSGSKGKSGQAENLIPSGIRSWSVQPIVICYTD